MEEPWFEEKSVVKRVQMDSAPPAMSDTNGFNAHLVPRAVIRVNCM